MKPPFAWRPPWQEQRSRLGLTRGGRPPVRPARRTLKLALLAASALAGAALGAAFGDAVLARIAPESARAFALAVTGNLHTDPARLAAASGLAAGQPFAQVDAREVARGLESLPWVRRARATKLAPNRVLVRIEERVPVAVARLADGSRHLVDASGVAFAPAPDEARGPELIGLERLPASGRADPALAGGVALLEEWGARPLPAAAAIEVGGAAPAELPAVLLADPALRVVLGAGDRADQLGRLARLFARAGAELASASAIDLRFPGQGVVRSAPPCAPETKLSGGTAATGEVSGAAAREGEQTCHAKTT